MQAKTNLKDINGDEQPLCVQMIILYYGVYNTFLWLRVTALIQQVPLREASTFLKLVFELTHTFACVTAAVSGSLRD